MTEDFKLLSPPTGEITLNLNLLTPEGIPQDLRSLIEILKLKRVANGKAEAALIKTLLVPLGAKYDSFKNYSITIPKVNGKWSKVLWSCHTDTVHRTDGVQNLAIDKHTGVISLNENSGCLGADDGAGLWLMLEMIKAKVPGHYVFHRQEETGCQGSQHRAKFRAKHMRKFNAAIAFDRRGTNSIITKQRGEFKCSPEFADSLADIIDMGHTKDPTGSFTDTASYSHLIPECTNVSIGYQNEHGPREILDTKYLLRLRNRMIMFDEELLIIKRDPIAKVVKPEYSYPNYGAYNGGEYTHTHGGNDAWWKKQEPIQKPLKVEYTDSINDLSNMIRGNSFRLAGMFERWGFDADTLADLIFTEYNSVSWPGHGVIHGKNNNGKPWDDEGGG